MVKTENKYRIILVLILFFALLIRLYRITEIPPIFGDEVQEANAALSYLKTGKDIDGKIHGFFYDEFQFNPPIIGLSMIPGFLLFGQSIFTIRVPAIIYSILSLFIFFKLVGLLTNSIKTALIATFILSFLPWDFHFSRIGWCQGSFLFYFLITIYYFLRGRFNKKYLLLGFLFAGLSFYTYSIAIIYSPIFLLGIILLFITDYKKNYFYILLGLIIFFIILLPFIHTSIYDPLTHQRGLNIFILKKYPFSEAFLLLIKQHLQHYSFSFLFQGGDQNLRHNIRNVGEIFLFMAPFLLLGLFKIVTKYSWNIKLFLIFWLLVFPLAAGLTNDGIPHAARSLPGAPILSLYTAIGVYSFWEIYQKYRVIKIVKIISILSILFIGAFSIKEISNYLYNYFYQYPLYSAASWEYGQPEVFGYVKRNAALYQKVCFYHLHKFTLNRFIPFYLSQELEYPTKFLNTPNLQECFVKNSLIVATPQYPKFKNLDLINNVYDPEGKPIYSFYRY